MRLKFWQKPPRFNFSKNIIRNRFPTFWQSIKKQIKSKRGGATIAGALVAIGVSAATAATVGTVVTVVSVVVSVGMTVYSIVSSITAKKGQSGGEGTTALDSGHLLNTRVASAVVPPVYGIIRVGGNLVYVNCFDERNQFLDIVMTVGEGPIGGLSTDITGGMVWLDNTRIQSFGAYASYEFYTGTSTQTVSAWIQGNDATWTDAMRYTAYVHVGLAYNPDYFGNIPQVTVQVQGRLLYDPRTATTAYSNNPALVAYDFMRNARYGGGFPQSAFDEDTISDCATWCENNGYTFNGVINIQQSFLDNLNDILRSFRGAIIWSEGEYKMIVQDYDAPVMVITEDEIVQDSFKINVPGIPETPNRVIVNYIDIVDNYLSKQRIIQNTDNVLTYDGEERDFYCDLIGVTTAEYAEILGAYYLDRARLNYQFSFACDARALALDALDMIEVTHYLPGWNEELVRVSEINQTQDGHAMLTVVQEDIALYDRVVNITTHNAYETTLPTPYDYEHFQGFIIIAVTNARNVQTSGSPFIGRITPSNTRNYLVASKPIVSTA